MLRLKNNYYLMRHGQSEANVAGLIVSDPVRGCNAFGLTKEGERQVLDAVERFDVAPSAIVCSDFLRTRQTAELVAVRLELPSVIVDVGLRERYFGCWEGNTDDCYKKVWAQDEATIDDENCQQQGDEQTTKGSRIETPDAVLCRGLDVLKRLEKNAEGDTFLLVSHGDMVQILQTAFVGIPASKHRQLAHHQTAEIKSLASIGENYTSSILLDCWNRSSVQ